MRAPWLLGWAAAIGCNFPRPEVADSGVDVPATDAAVCNEAQCVLGCVVAESRCRDVEPSNGLGIWLDMTANEQNVDLGSNAAINTSDGTITVDGAPIVVKSVAHAQDAAPVIRVLIVHRLHAMNVTVTGDKALAIVADGEIRIDGIMSASGQSNVSGPGRLNDAECRGADANFDGPASGSGGGGFGMPGGNGGTASNASGTSQGGRRGAATGNASLVPLRGGCDGGVYSGTVFGAGGGAVQLVSRVRVAVAGTVAANGTSYGSGGSGGGILIEAPTVDVSGAVVANGGAGSSGCAVPTLGEDGRRDAKPAAAGFGCAAGNGATGGDGGALNFGAGNGMSVSRTTGGALFAGHGGGGVGRIRVNTLAGGLQASGIFSPLPSTGDLATR